LFSFCDENSLGEAFKSQAQLLVLAQLILPLGRWVSANGLVPEIVVWVAENEE
jgi:hypothetical protein